MALHSEAEYNIKGNLHYILSVSDFQTKVTESALCFLSVCSNKRKRKQMLLPSVPWPKMLPHLQLIADRSLTSTKVRVNQRVKRLLEKTEEQVSKYNAGVVRETHSFHKTTKTT